MARRPLTGRVDLNAKVLVLRCATGDSSAFTVEPDGVGRNDGLRLAISDHPSESTHDIYIDDKAARELFNYLGVWLHTR